MIQLSSKICFIVGSLIKLRRRRNRFTHIDTNVEFVYNTFSVCFDADRPLYRMLLCISVSG
jgi:hypothetical protein